VSVKIAVEIIKRRVGSGNKTVESVHKPVESVKKDL
jgi:hypothetical protein